MAITHRRRRVAGRGPRAARPPSASTVVGSARPAEQSAVEAPSQAPAQGRWLALVTMAAAMVLAMTTWFSASAVLPQLRELWSLSSTAGSWLTISVQLGFVIGALVSAFVSLADVVPPRRLVLYGTLGAALANVGLLAVNGAAGAIALRFLTGVSLAAVYPPALKATATWFRAGRGLALGVMVGALTLGSATPHLVNGLGGFDWRGVIVATSLLTVLGGALMEWVASDGPYPFPRARFDPRQAGLAFLNRGVRLASIGYFGHMWELYAMWAWFSAFFADALARRGSGDATTAAAIVTFVVIGSGLAGSIVGGLLGDRWGKARTTILAMAISGTSAAVIGLFRDAHPALLVVIGLVWGFWVVADSAQFSAIVTEVADQSYAGTAVTLQLAAGFVLTVVTIWLIPELVELVSWQWAFAVLAPGPLVGIVAMRKLVTH